MIQKIHIRPSGGFKKPSIGPLGLHKDKDHIKIFYSWKIKEGSSTAKRDLLKVFWCLRTFSRIPTFLTFDSQIQKIHMRASRIRKAS